jgi:hypothetical protein
VSGLGLLPLSVLILKVNMSERCDRASGATATREVCSGI